MSQFSNFSKRSVQLLRIYLNKTEWTWVFSDLLCPLPIIQILFERTKLYNSWWKIFFLYEMSLWWSLCQKKINDLRASFCRHLREPPFVLEQLSTNEALDCDFCQGHPLPKLLPSNPKAKTGVKIFQNCLRLLCHLN